MRQTTSLRTFSLLLATVYCLQFFPCMGVAKQETRGDGNIAVRGSENVIQNIYGVSVSPALLPHKPSPVRSDLRVPLDAVLLKRPELMERLEEKFSQPRNAHTIPSLCIIGQGGEGKTTLARMRAAAWGEKHPRATIWEINAETPTTLSLSFRALAFSLAQTAELREELGFIHQIQDPIEQESQRLHFIKKQLRLQKEWVLIYDNVEHYKDIVQYLPLEGNMWGEGRLIITTRNEHIKNAETFNPADIIQIGPLTPQEKLDLFLKIQFNLSATSAPAQQVSEIELFLTEIPSSPLDVSVAAKYIKTHHLSLKKYLEMLKAQDKGFYEEQKALQEETSSYAKSRYGIIKLALDRICLLDVSFVDFLGCLSFLDSQNIPVDLLETYKGEAKAQQFIHELKKYSLLTEETATVHTPSFSIHRSTQAICRSYFLKNKKAEGVHVAADLSRVFLPYAQNIIERSSNYQIRVLVPHIEALGRQEFSKVCSPSARIVLGMAHYELAEYHKAKVFLEQGLAEMSGQDLHNRKEVALAEIYLGLIHKYLGRVEQAENCINTALHLYKKGHDLFGYARSLALLGGLYTSAHSYKDAKKYLKASLVISEKYNLNSIALPHALLSLGVVYIYLCKFQKADRLLAHSLSLYKKQDIAREQGWALFYRGKLKRTVGEYRRAISYLEECLLTFKAHYLENHPCFGWVYVELGAAYSLLGDYEKARALVEKAAQNCYKVCEINKLPANRYLAQVLAQLGGIYSKIGLYKKAEIFLNESKKIYKISSAKLGRRKQASFFLLFGELYLGVQKYALAEKYLLKGLEWFQKNVPSDHLKIAQTYLNMAQVKLHTKEYDKAINLTTIALKTYKKYYGEKHLKVAKSLWVLGEIYASVGEKEKATEVLQLARDNLQENNHPDLHYPLESLALLCRKEADGEEAKENHQQAEALRQKAVSLLGEALRIAAKVYPRDSAHFTRLHEQFSYASRDNRYSKGGKR